MGKWERRGEGRGGEREVTSGWGGVHGLHLRYLVDL